MKRNAKPVDANPYRPTPENIAAVTGNTLLAAKLLSASGWYGDASGYAPRFGSKAEVGRYFNVSERTVSTWIGEGAPPADANGQYNLAAIRRWRFDKAWFSQGPKIMDVELLTGGAHDARKYATGDAMRGLLRVLRLELPKMAAAIAAKAVKSSGLSKADAAKLGTAITETAEPIIAPLVLDEDEIEELLRSVFYLM